MSARTTLAQLVPFYIEGPNPRGIFTKQWAVRAIVAGRLNSGHDGYHSRKSVHGKGRKAARRAERLQAEFEAREDAACNGWFDERELTEADVDALAAERERKRVARRYLELPIGLNIHE